MKKITTAAFAALLTAAVVSAQRVTQTPASEATLQPATDGPFFAWEKTSYDFGQVLHNKPVAVSYTFTNSGKKPLIITNVSVQCGCTGAEFTKEAVAPGRKGFVKLTFNAAAVGVFQKSVTVLSNVNPTGTVLTFKGEVVGSETTLK